MIGLAEAGGLDDAEEDEDGDTVPGGALVMRPGAGFAAGLGLLPSFPPVKLPAAKIPRISQISFR